MHVRQAVALLALAAAAAASTANADQIFTVTATYDAFGTGNTTFEIDNLSGQELTGVDISSGNNNKLQLDIAAHGSEIYTFDDQLGGPFNQAPGDKGVPDTTTYQVTANYLGQSISTALFSSVSNLTGQYVDFLGSCFTNHGGCSQPDPAANFDLSDVVAQGVTPVPLPASLLLLASGGLFGFTRRIRGNQK